VVVSLLKSGLCSKRNEAAVVLGISRDSTCITHEFIIHVTSMSLLYSVS
jgi:hypothetical protein